MKKDKTSSYRTKNLEALSKRLRSLKITNEVSSEMNKRSDKEMSVAPVPVTMNDNIQAITPKSMVLDPECFNRNWMKFEDW